MAADCRRSYYSAISLLLYYYVENINTRLKNIHKSIFVFAVRTFSVSQPPTATNRSAVISRILIYYFSVYKIPWRKSVVAVQCGLHFYYRFQLRQGDIHCLCIVIMTAERKCQGEGEWTTIGNILDVDVVATTTLIQYSHLMPIDCSINWFEFHRSINFASDCWKSLQLPLKIGGLPNSQPMPQYMN